jgi:nucleotide-binding universal stress UspA family protein
MITRREDRRFSYPLRQEETIMLKKLLVAFDGSEQSYRAFDFALEMTRLCGDAPEITVIAVAQPAEPLGTKESDSLLDSAGKLYEHLFKGLRDKALRANVEIQTEIVTGHPAHEIIEYAEKKKSHIVIMGQRGRSKVAKFLLGSVSKRVSTYAPCTVAIVK